MEVSFKTITSKESKLEVQHTTNIKKVMIKIHCNGDIFSEEQHFELSSERAADYVKKESILDLGSGNIRISVKTEYGKFIVFKIESSCDIDNVKQVIKQADDESAFELLITLMSNYQNPFIAFLIRRNSVENEHSLLLFGVFETIVWNFHSIG